MTPRDAREQQIAALSRAERRNALAEPCFGWSQGDDDAMRSVGRLAWAVGVGPETAVTVTVADLRTLLAAAGQSKQRYALAEEYRIERDSVRATTDAAWREKVREAVADVRASECWPLDGLPSQGFDAALAALVSRLGLEETR